MRMSVGVYQFLKLYQLDMGESPIQCTRRLSSSGASPQRASPLLRASEKDPRVCVVKPRDLE